MKTNEHKLLSFILVQILTVTTLHAQNVFHDAAIFNAPMGQVKQIEYKDGLVCFTKEGRLNKETSTYLESFSTYEIVHNAEGYPIQLTTDFNQSIFEYTQDHRLSKCKVIGTNNMILNYEYSSDGTIKLTRTQFEMGVPQKSEIVYDMNMFDYNGNWIQKGFKGNLVQTVNVDNYHVGTIGSGYDKQYVSTDSHWEGREKETREITYWDSFLFQCSDSPNEVSFMDLLCPFFLGRLLITPKEAEKLLKETGVPYTKEKHYGKKELKVSKCNKLFYGMPLSDMVFSFYSEKYGGDYSIVIPMKNEKQLYDFIRFLHNELKNQDNPKVSFSEEEYDKFTLIYYDGYHNVSVCALSSSDVGYGVIIKR